MEIVGLNRFIMVFRINDLHDFSKNHYEIIDPVIKQNIKLRELCTIATRPKFTKCGDYYETISDYYYLVLQNNEFNLVNDLFVPENQQIIVLLNKSFNLNSNSEFRIIFNRILYYINLRTPEFLRAANFNLSKNILYKSFFYDPLPGSKMTYNVPKNNIFEYDLIN